MKKKKTIAGKARPSFWINLLVVLICSVAVGQYDISWSTIDNGGGEISGDFYVLTGTIGQSDAGVMSGGNYELLGGFWPGAHYCVVDFRHYARFAEYWLETGSGLPADLYEDGIVDFYDLELFVDEWLYYCPYDWPLR